MLPLCSTCLLRLERVLSYAAGAATHPSRHVSPLEADSTSCQHIGPSIELNPKRLLCLVFSIFLYCLLLCPSISISLAFVPLCLLIRFFSAPSVPVGEKTRHISFRHRMVMHRGKAANATVTTVFLKGPETLTNFFFHFVCPLRYPAATGRSFNFTPHSYSLCCCELKERKKESWWKHHEELRWVGTTAWTLFRFNETEMSLEECATR